MLLNHAAMGMLRLSSGKRLLVYNSCFVHTVVPFCDVKGSFLCDLGFYTWLTLVKK